MSDPTTESGAGSGGAGPIIIRRGVDVWRNHGTKILGYVTIVAGSIAVMDPQLVSATLGPNTVRWALLISGVATALRGHTNKLQPVNTAEQANR